MSYNLGNVKPWVAAAANEIGPKFGIRTVYGYSYRNIAGTSILSDHALGLALDFMCDIPTGDSLAAYVQANAGRLNVTYIIHNRRIWSVARSREGWRTYTGVNPHTDHVHVSFEAKPTGGGATATAQPADWAPLPIPGGGSVPIPLPKGGKGLPGDIPNPVDTAKQTYEALKSIAKVATLLTSPAGWMRLLMFGAGLWLIAIAVAALIKNQDARDVVKQGTRTAVRTTTKAVQNG